MVSTVRWTDLDVIAARIGEADGKPLGKYTGETLLPRTINVMTPQVNEGFFADVVLLVEGPSDRAALLAVASRRGIDLDEFGAIIVPVESKDNLDRPYCVFTGLGIPCYFIFDGDRSRAGDGHPGTNRRLLILGGADPVDFPETVATGAFACFAENLETEMRAELSSEVYDAALDAACKEFGYPKREDGLKNPAVVQRVLEAAQEQGRTICVLEAALDKALALSSTCSG